MARRKKPTQAQAPTLPEREGEESGPASNGTSHSSSSRSGRTPGAAGRWVPLLLLAYFFLAFGYSAVTPPPNASGQHNPDEAAHVQYVATLASGHLSVFTDAAHGYENHQPPLYYALCAPVYLAARGHGDAAATRAVRGVSILLGALLILAAYGCIRCLLPGHPALALGTAAFVALLPGNVALCASVTNDALTNLVFAAALWQLVRLVTSPDPDTPPALWRRRALRLGLTLGLGVWTKTSTLTLFPVVLLAFYFVARRGLMTAARAARGALLTCGLGLILGLPWLGRNQLLYGDPLAQHIFVTAFARTAQADTITRYVFDGSVGGYLLGVARWTFASFWGGFDSGLIFWGQDPRARLDPSAPGAYGIYGGMPPPFYALFLALSLASLAGVFLRLRREPPDARQGVALSAFAALVGLVGFVFLRFILTFFQAQGRYLYPALVPLAFFFVWGGQGLSPRPARRRAFVGLLAAGLVALNLYTIFGLLAPRFS